MTYSASIPVYLLDGGTPISTTSKDPSKPYLELVLKGEGIFPMLTFYPHEVFSIPSPPFHSPLLLEQLSDSIL